MLLSRLRCAFASARQPKSPPQDAIMRKLEMIHADVQTIVDGLNALPDQIKAAAQTAVSNAEGAKDTDHADDVAALTTALAGVQAAVAGINAPAQ